MQENSLTACSPEPCSVISDISNRVLPHNLLLLFTPTSSIPMYSSFPPLPVPPPFSLSSSYMLFMMLLSDIS